MYSRTEGDKKDFCDVNNAFSVADVLIYTPALTAGVSFEVKHFDYMYGLFDHTSCSAEICSQMLGRIRDIKHK